MTTQVCRNCGDAPGTVPGKATFFCPDSPVQRSLLCGRCCGLLHHPGTQGEFDSVEEIDGEKLGFHVFSALLDLVLLPVLLLLILYKSGIPDDYLDGLDVCPTVGSLRRFLAHQDPSVLSLLKTFNMPTSICGLEDGYIRLFYDAWVRGIATGTDSWLLLLTTLPRALLFHASFIALLTPLVALTHAALSSSLYMLEELVVSRIPIMPKVALALQSFTDSVAPDAPPLTKARKRPSKNFIEGLVYWISRRLRIFRHCYTVAGSRISSFGLMSLAVAILLRVFCLTLTSGFGFTLQGYLPLDDRFSAASGGLSDQLLLGALPGALIVLKGLAQKLVPPLLGLGAAVAALGLILKKQTAEFYKRWVPPEYEQ
mmetsp:Transcript_102476/g.182043  ORF Transcript_102476/g.182043 Transcript_102476/m.182043 type:complete len:370 (+) Transcript_102476:56-1165(+)|eukprot:CAMPEP_0197639844 /NCGR_PEP_ID=MMETSP1338-20131121/14338_1 /TAXON_ID=43686 ORGANISM="Pelagodinium beii, Strain RCC1491" /NCGR_SAMPLE_ID=MMETSP1338 /ASSEMBLY_ACC=CAM_ASM_000754 /LENGTH=369 /DNA_ID=CAMNT_0043212625 /DNA_START=56 /DNA_END=1165 /DNA_ORIENTATION=-